MCRLHTQGGDTQTAAQLLEDRMGVLAEGEPQTAAAQKALLAVVAVAVAGGDVEGVRRAWELCMLFESRSGDGREAGFAAEVRAVESRLGRIHGDAGQVIPPTLPPGGSSMFAAQPDNEWQTA